MITKSLSTTKSYSKLLTELKSILVEGLKAIEEQRVKTYWQTGQLICKYLLGNEERAGYGEGLFIQLSKDLGIGERLLYDSVQFYQTYPNLHTYANLQWSHFRLLLGVEDKQKRLTFHNQALKYNWSIEELKNAIRIYKLKNKDLEVEAGADATKLSLVRGRLYTYRLIKAEKLNPAQSNLLVDCGFGLWRQVSLAGIRSPQESDIVESVKSDSGYQLKKTDFRRNKLFTYKAFVEKVSDADTIWVQIDLGFKSFSRQKLRFRGIDAPELSTQKGVRAKEFVEARLSQVSFIVIKTYSPDKYDRYLTDVFYLPGEENPPSVLEEGIFLNQELLNAGLARLA